MSWQASLLARQDEPEGEDCHVVAKGEDGLECLGKPVFWLAAKEKTSSPVKNAHQRGTMEARFCYVYMLQSLGRPDHWYVGMTEDLQKRLKAHNAGQVSYTAKSLPWRIETAVAFRDKAKALAFEKYLKSQSGRAFAKKHF